MENGSYRTIVAPGEAAFRVKGSRFIGRIAPVTSVEEAESVIEGLRTDHPDATHVVPAYRIRADPFREYHDDAGEPRGSAGPPMLSVLQGESLENVVAVVVRYYGGTNLGIGGLSRAYARAVSLALESTEIHEQEPHTRLQIETSYDDSGTVRSILEGSEASFEAAYAASVSFVVTIPLSDVDALQDRVLSATSGRAEIEDR